MASNLEQPRIAIVGAGLAGTLMSIYLGKAGYAVDVYEKRRDPRVGEADQGRSINLALSTRGVHALEEVGVADDVLVDAVAMRGRMMHSPAGEITFQPYGKDASQCINSVSRSGLNIALLNAAEQFSTVSLHFDSKCTAADLVSGEIEIAEGGTGGCRTIKPDLVIGSDGAFSVIRRHMQHLDRFDYRQQYLTHGYKELIIPPGAGGEFRIEKNALHIWPRGGYMMIALPNSDASFTCTLFWPLEGPNSFAALDAGRNIEGYFREHFADAVPHMPTLVEDYQHNHSSSLVTVRCNPWHYGERFVLLGDAAHAVVPFYGQGMNASFEDCSVLNECVQRFAPDWQRVFCEYNRLRKENTDALADLAISNFLEMRDHVASRSFLLKKKGEMWLYRLLPGLFLPLYAMVTFTRRPYAEALRRARLQWRVFRGAVVGMIVLVLLILLAFMW